MNIWRWYYGAKENVEEDGLYDVDYDTKELAILGALQNFDDGDEFYIIEAVCREEREEGEAEDDPVMFSHFRNKELWLVRDGRGELVRAIS
jgi:hypothetical protein